jgi:diadenylate cyclase
MVSYIKIVRDIFDILIVTYILYRIMVILKGTRALQMLVGLIIIVVAFLLSDLLGLQTINWLLSSFLASIVLVIIILFQDDIRRALVQMGRRSVFFTGNESSMSIIEEVIKASAVMATKKIGALIVFQRTQKLDNHLEIGTIIDAEVNSELLQSIFLPHSPMHDGAVVINEGRIHAAGCILPLSTSTKIPRYLGTRHRAAFGITEVTDSVVVVVSEERGTISLVVGENIYFNLETGELRKKLNEIFEITPPEVVKKSK